MKTNIFEKIIKKELPADIIYQDKYVTAFKDIKPLAPKHFIIVTNIFIKNVNHISYGHEKYIIKMFIAASKIAKKEKFKKDGYRLVINCNKHGRQEIYHLHMHLLGGKKLSSIFC